MVIRWYNRGIWWYNNKKLEYISQLRIEKSGLISFVQEEAPEIPKIFRYCSTYKQRSFLVLFGLTYMATDKCGMKFREGSYGIVFECVSIKYPGNQLGLGLHEEKNSACTVTVKSFKTFEVQIVLMKTC